MKIIIILISLIISGIDFVFCQVDTFELNEARMGIRNFNYVSGPYDGPEDDTTGMAIGPIPGNGTFSNRSMSITDFQDVQVYASAFQETEPHLTINKNHPNNIILSSNYVRWLGTCIPCTCATCTTYTVGQSIFWNENYNNPTPTWWGSLTLPNATNEGNDPSTAIDAMGNYYVSGIEQHTQSILFESTTQPPYANAISWPNQTWAWTPSTSTNIDKDMIAVDNLPQDPNSSVVSVNWIYAVWTNYDPHTSNPVQFSCSSVGPVPSFSSTIDLNDRFGSGSNVQTGPNHEVYVCWADFGEYYNGSPPVLKPCNAAALFSPCYPPRKIGFASGTPVNNGVNFIAAAYPIDLTSAGSISNGGIQFNNLGLPPLNNTRANDFPSMAVDKSCGLYRGRIYIAYAANDINFPNPSYASFKSRVFLQYSDDQGLNFHTCNTNGVVDDNGYQNWMPWVSVDPATGNVYVAYYKTTALTPNYTTCVFLAYSDDYGSSFSQIQVSGLCFTPRPLPEPPFHGGYNGDYIACDAYAGNIYVAWPQNLGSQTNPYPQNNIFCSRLVASTPALIRSGTGIDLNLNGIVDIQSPPNSPDNVTYEAYNNITVAADQQKFVISSGGTATFHAGKSIHVLPGSVTGNDFGALNGSLTHLYVSGVDPSCTTPFRIGNFNHEINKNSDNENDILNTYPNPFQNNFDLKFSVEKDENESISIFDSYGHKIINVITNQWIKSGVYNVKIDMYEKPPGIYYIILQSDQNMFVKKIIKL